MGSFVEKFDDKFYPNEKSSHNVHHLTHLVDAVSRFGPLWVWSNFPFEDADGYFKKLNHDTNKVDMELAKTLKMLNAYIVLKSKLNEKKEVIDPFPCVLGAKIQIFLIRREKKFLENSSVFNSIKITGNRIFVYLGAKINNETFTLKLYKRQKKRRKNKIISWYDKQKF